MTEIILIIAVGMLIGYFPILPKRLSQLPSLLMTFGLLFLLFSMGTSVGINPDVMNNLGHIGYQSFFLAIATVIGSIGCILLFEWKLIHNNSDFRVNSKSSENQKETDEAQSHGVPIFTWLIIISVVLGVVGGILKWLPTVYMEHIGRFIEMALYITIFAVGVDIGGNRKAWQQLRQLGFKALLFPVFVGVGSIAGAIIIGFFLRLPFNEAGAIGAGFGWYSLSGVLLAKIHSAELGALGFLTNVLREIIAILSMPLLAKYRSYMVAVSTGGATTMDSTLPIVARVTNGEMTMLALVNGFTLTMAVPVLVPLFIKL